MTIFPHNPEMESNPKLATGLKKFFQVVVFQTCLFLIFAAVIIFKEGHLSERNNAFLPYLLLFVLSSGIADGYVAVFSKKASRRMQRLQSRFILTVLLAFFSMILSALKQLF